MEHSVRCSFSTLYLNYTVGWGYYQEGRWGEVREGGWRRWKGGSFCSPSQYLHLLLSSFFLSLLLTFPLSCSLPLFSLFLHSFPFLSISLPPLPLFSFSFLLHLFSTSLFPSPYSIFTSFPPLFLLPSLFLLSSSLLFLLHTSISCSSNPRSLLFFLLQLPSLSSPLFSFNLLVNTKKLIVKPDFLSEQRVLALLVLLYRSI